MGLAGGLGFLGFSNVQLKISAKPQLDVVAIADAIAAAQRSNVIIYVILIADREGYFSQGLGYSGYSAAKRISDETGGRLMCKVHEQWTVTSPVRVGSGTRGRSRSVTPIVM